MSEPEYRKSRSDLANEVGFTGTLAAFLDWLKESLVYGGIVVKELEPDRWGRVKVQVETITGGYSSDERLLSRVGRSLYMQSQWVKSERGGSVTYEFPLKWTTDEESLVWLVPEAEDRLHTMHRVRTLRVVAPSGDTIELDFKGGVELLYREPDRDILKPDAVLVVQAAKDLDEIL